MSSGVAASTSRTRTSVAGISPAPSATSAAILAVLPLAEWYRTSTLPIRTPRVRNNSVDDAQDTICVKPRTAGRPNPARPSGVRDMLLCGGVMELIVLVGLQGSGK